MNTSAGRNNRALIRQLSGFVVAGFALVLAAGCGPAGKPKPISDLARKQAEHSASEAQFAMTMRDWARAEAELTKTVELDPNTGAYWVSLGAMRMKLGNRSGAKAAYKGALAAFEGDAAGEKNDPEPWLQQVYVLALLGRVDDARVLLGKTAKKFPDQRNVRLFIEGKQFDHMLADPMFKENAL
jgi:Flp pilus assembly protein TadD